MKIEFEYLVIWSQVPLSETQLNELGGDRWELICIWNNNFYFKRTYES